MKFGIRLPCSGPFATEESLIAVAEKADELGYEFIGMNDVFVLSHDRRYHFSAGTVEETDKSEDPTRVYEIMSTLSFLAGRTDKVKLLTSAAVLPLRNPILLAKQSISLSRLSKERFILGVCIGNLEDVFQAFGVSWKQRAAISDEYLEALHTILTGKGPVNYSGKYLDLKDVEISPRPKHIPIWIGGGFNEAVFNRIAKFGDGWEPIGTPEDFRRGVPILKNYLSKYGRKDTVEVCNHVMLCYANSMDESLKVCGKTLSVFSSLPEVKRSTQEGFEKKGFIGGPKEVFARVEEYSSAGVTSSELRFVCPNLTSMLEMMKKFAKEIMASYS